MANASASHVFVSGIADDPASQAAGEVLASHWNAAHTIAAGGSTTQVQVNSGGAIVGSPFFTFDNAQMAIGNASALGGGSLYGNYPPIILDIEATYTVDPPSGYVTGQVVYINADFGAPSTAGVDGGVFNAANATANAVQYVNGFTASGYGFATQKVTGGNFFGTGTGTTPVVYGIEVGSTNAGSGTIADVYGQKIYGGVINGGGSITNLYGLAVNDQTVGTNNWAIKTGLGKVQFGDFVTIDALTASQVVVTDANKKLISGGTLGTMAAASTGDYLAVAGGTMSGPITLGENTSIALDPALSADGKYSGITITGTGGAVIAFGDLVTLDKDDSRWELVDISVAAAATGDARGILGMAVTSSTDGGALTILLQGNIRADANFPTLTIGAPVYASTTGDVVVTQPSTADYVIRIIGYGLTADELYFNPGNTWITHV